MLPAVPMRFFKFLLTGVVFVAVINWSRYDVVYTQVECRPNDWTRYEFSDDLLRYQKAKNFPNLPEVGTSSVNGNSSQRKIRLMEDIPDVIYDATYGSKPRMCKTKEYNTTELPSVSIIITYHDNENSVDILRTIESILRRTDRNLLKEIILVDDHCTKEELVSVMEQYVVSVYAGDLVRFVRNPGQPGLIAARHFGILESSGEVVICMDSHVEVQKIWLEPLLEAIVENPNTVASSYLDWMEYKFDRKWHYLTGGSTWKTYFDWGLQFGFQEMSPRQRHSLPDNTVPIESPVMVGTLWAMRKDYYLAVGGLDQKLQGWGGENIDLPIKVWLSGGRVVNVPCSHAAHLEAPHKRSYRFTNGWPEKIERNYIRVVEKWFGDYKKYFYYYKPSAKRVVTTNNRTATRGEKATLHDFSWYLNNIFPELAMYDVDSLAYGFVRNAKHHTCLIHTSEQIGLSSCSNHKRPKQIFIWNSKGELRTQMHIVVHSMTAAKRNPNLPLKIHSYMPLHNSDTNLKWFHTKNGQLAVNTETTRQVNSDSKHLVTHCLTTTDGYTLALESCNQTDSRQKWSFDSYTNLYEDVKLNNLNNFNDREYATRLQTFIREQDNIHYSSIK